MSKESYPGAMFGEDVRFEPDAALQEPKMYRVILHNDHYTTMDFVIEALVKVFHKPTAAAIKIMFDIHKKGTGMCGVYTFDIASTKVSLVHHMAKQREFPLKCSLEEA